MSESELIAFFRDLQSSSQNLCGRFREDQLQKDYDIEEWFPTWTIENNQLRYEIPLNIIKPKQAIKLPLIYNMKVVRNMAAAVLTLLSIEQGIGQNRIISGRVVDENNEGLPGASISIKGKPVGTISDINGNYNIEVSDKDILIFGLIGFEQTEKKASASKDLLQLEMKAEVMGLFETVTNYYISERKDGTSSYINYNSYEPVIKKKFASGITVWGNAVQNGELILVPELVASKDSIENSFEHINDERWFRENGFQQITSVQLYDYSGRIFQERYEKLNDGMISVDVRGLPQGAYLVRAVYKNERSLTENEISTARVLIEK